MDDFYDPIDFSGIVGYPHDRSSDVLKTLLTMVIMMMLVLTSGPSLNVLMNGVIHLFMRTF
jgi:hypothetical protein